MENLRLGQSGIENKQQTNQSNLSTSSNENTEEDRASLSSRITNAKAQIGSWGDGSSFAYHEEESPPNSIYVPEVVGEVIPGAVFPDQNEAQIKDTYPNPGETLEDIFF